MNERLPREIRNMIWTDYPMRTAWGNASDRFKNCPELHRSKPNAHKKWSCFPPVIRREFVDVDTAREVVEAWYKDWHFKTHMGVDLYRIILMDVFNLNVDTAAVLRKLSLSGGMADFADYRQSPDVPKQARVLRLLEMLYKIKRKQGFRLDIDVTQTSIRLNVWHAFVFEPYRDLLHDFESEGAIVTIRFSYCSGRKWHETKYPHAVGFDITDLVRHHDPETWKIGVIEKLNQHIARPTDNMQTFFWRNFFTDPALHITALPRVIAGLGLT
ncbi:predicted protein [Pyrenophora tritici-repentis Pt-1C-BFP]|uniref:Uncharacterized protein n=1 Tax=Pyrenophora tritici-repentis (strain Pt-1C-BFP) TaxID=426418 RepID=B2WMV2_PYRTR|nr:uncharacterized protein PTRG_11312 [Pyrenophora tritici-repentis Pt-1C-BFP]EDU44362.1 predicted protein [Pyrenophora tritici-repentis Pt-1C-BFP]